MYIQIVSFVKSQVFIVTILKSVEVHFLKYLSLGPTKILLIVPFYVSFKPHLDASRYHQKAVNGALKFKFAWGKFPQTPLPEHAGN